MYSTNNIGCDDFKLRHFYNIKILALKAALNHIKMAAVANPTKKIPKKCINKAFFFLINITLIEYKWKNHFRCPTLAFKGVLVLLRHGF